MAPLNWVATTGFRHLGTLIANDKPVLRERRHLAIGQTTLNVIPKLADGICIGVKALILTVLLTTIFNN